MGLNNKRIIVAFLVSLGGFCATILYLPPGYPYLVSAVILFLFWLKFDRPRYIFWVAIFSFIFWQVFGIVFIFFIPVGVVLGIGALIYGYFSGIMRNNIPKPNEPMNIDPSPPITKNIIFRTLIIGIFVAIIIFAIFIISEMNWIFNNVH
jgi:hypothetical protein